MIELLIVISAKLIMVQLTTEQRIFILSYSTTEMKTQLKYKTLFEQHFLIGTLRNELRQQPDFVRRLDERCVLCSRELNYFVSSEMEGMSKDMALDKFNSR